MKSLLLLSLFIMAQSSFAQQTCLDVFTKKIDPTGAQVNEYVQGDANTAIDPLAILVSSFRQNLFTGQQISFVENQLTKSGLLNAPIDMTRRSSRYREQILPILRFEPVYREATLRFMESDLRLRTALLTDRILNGPRRTYDVVVMGAGIHGAIAVNRILAENPYYKILVIEETDTAGWDPLESTCRHASLSIL